MAGRGRWPGHCLQSLPDLSWWCVPSSCSIALARMGLSEDPVRSGASSPGLWKLSLWGCPESLLCLRASPPPYSWDGTHQDQSRCQGLAWKQSWSVHFTCCPVTAACLGTLLLHRPFTCHSPCVSLISGFHYMAHFILLKTFFFQIF